MRESLCVGGCICFCVYERKCLRAKERTRDGERRQRLSARTCASVTTLLTRQVICQCGVLLQQFAMSIGVMVQEKENIMYVSIYLSIYLSIYPSIHPSIHPSICLYAYTYENTRTSAHTYTYVYTVIHMHFGYTIKHKYIRGSKSDFELPLVWTLRI